jgi:hypothetical protein
MLLPKIKLQKLVWYKWNYSRKYDFTKGMNDIMYGIQDVIVEGKVDETVKQSSV